MTAVTEKLHPLLGKHQGNGSWCNNPEIYCLKRTDVWGSLNISPTWFQQVHETVQDWPEAATIFRKPATLEWLDAISQSNSILSAILAVIHLPLHKAGQKTFNQLRQRTNIQPQDVLRQWTSILNSIAVICNHLTPPHQDSESRRKWYDLLVTLGCYQNCNLELLGLGLSSKYGPGTVVGILGVTLEHEVPSFDGERVCYAYFMRDNIHEWAKVSGNSWMTTSHYWQGRGNT
ncbi:hypothetical protein EI94DRAFT_1611517 [Lactarius quietus]|nr:hypothetical protein EI94DRAFT_1611517 [Lactarius quietus]